jgi:hypothetical protein
MAAITNALAYFGLKATASPVGTSISGTNTVGVSQTAVAFDDANIAYSFKVVSTGATDVATLTLSSGVVAQTTGTPTITDGDGKDMEGITLGTLATSRMILIQPDSGNTGIVRAQSSSTTDGFDKYFPAASTRPLLCSFPASGTIAFTFAAIGDEVTVTVIGKTA